MKKTLGVLTTVVAALFLGVTAEAARLSEATSEAGIVDRLGGGWEATFGYVVDDVNRIPDGLHGSEREMMEKRAAAAREIGAKAFAELSYTHVAEPLDMVTLRVYVFATAELAARYREAHFPTKRAGDSYWIVDNEGRVVLDSKHHNERMVFAGRIWITGTEVRGGDLHHELIDELIAQVGP